MCASHAAQIWISSTFFPRVHARFDLDFKKNVQLCLLNSHAKIVFGTVLSQVDSSSACELRARKSRCHLVDVERTFDSDAVDNSLCGVSLSICNGDRGRGYVGAFKQPKVTGWHLQQLQMSMSVELRSSPRFRSKIE